MALEFDCPYCKATIRVPDNTAGKRGRCPQCASQLTIPKLGQARRAGEAQPVFPPPEAVDPAAATVDEEDVVFLEYDTNDDTGIDPAVQASLPPGDIAIPALVGPSLTSLPPPVKYLPD